MKKTVKVAKTPQGVSPLYVRQALVGITFVPDKQDRADYLVPVRYIIDKLIEEHQTSAAQWLNDHVLMAFDSYPVRFSDCELVSS